MALGLKDREDLEESSLWSSMYIHVAGGSRGRFVRKCQAQAQKYYPWGLMKLSPRVHCSKGQAWMNLLERCICQLCVLDN